MERKVILTDKLRCEVNWHKEIQEKAHLKKEVEHLKEQLKGFGFPKHNERPSKMNSFYECSRGEPRQVSRSPNSSFYK